jgi:hypothetical protein
MSERRSAADPGFTRVAIVNRGEAAVRLIRAVRELNLEHDGGMQTIALHTEAERRAMFVREADEAVTIGCSSVKGIRLAAGPPSFLRAALGLFSAKAGAGPWGRFYVAHPDRVPVLAYERDPDRRAALAVTDEHGRSVVVEYVALAPLAQGGHDGVELPAFLGQPVLVPRALAGLLVRGPDEDPVLDEQPETFREKRAGNAEPLPEVHEPAHAEEGFA